MMLMVMDSSQSSRNDELVPEIIKEPNVRGVSRESQQGIILSPRVDEILSQPSLSTINNHQLHGNNIRLNGQEESMLFSPKERRSQEYEKLIFQTLHARTDNYFNEPSEEINTQLLF